MRNRTTQQLAEALASVEARLARLERLPIVEAAPRWNRLTVIKHRLRYEIGSRCDGWQTVQRVAA